MFYIKKYMKNNKNLQAKYDISMKIITFVMC